MSNIYHATPYDLEAAGFYFSSLEDYRRQAAEHRNSYGDIVEEFSIQYIDGDQYELFNALGVNQANLDVWFESFEDMDGDDLVKAIYLCSYVGASMEDVLDRLDDVSFMEGEALAYATDYIDDCGLLDDMPENLRYYFDTESFARDLVLAGDITEVDIMGRSYVFWGC